MNIYDSNIGMLDVDDLDLWYYFIIIYYDKILWWNFMIWIYVMMDDDEMMWDDDVWNYVVLFLCWYCDEMIWTVVKMNCGKWWNDGGGWYDLRCVCV